MILGSREIKKLIREKNLLEDYLEENVEGAGVDFRVNCLYKLKSPAKLTKDLRELPETEKIDKETFLIKPEEYFLVETIEKVNMPVDIAARMLPRSTLHRSGVYLFHAFIDPGYKGKLVFGIKNLSKTDFELGKGAKICQLIFEQVKGKTKSYDGKYQGGKVT